MSLALTQPSEIGLRKAVKLDVKNKVRHRKTIRYGSPERDAHSSTAIPDAAIEKATLT